MSGKRFIRTCMALVATISVASCQANPGDAPTVEEESTTTSTPAPLNRDDRGKGKQITVGVDAFTSNLNPHLAGNESPLISAIADLTLPSAFVLGPGGWVQDTNLLSEVTPNDPQAPTAIRYKLNPQAQWSDGTPVTSSDFEYLANQMAKTAGVEGADGYRRIAKFESQGSATEFSITLKEPYTAWKELFRHVLPSHIYRAENHRFNEMMENASAASAGAYMVAAVDAGRGIVELQRNDRYWGANPALTDKLVFTVVPDTATAAQMLRTGQIQMLAMRPAEQSQLAVQQIKGVQQRITSRAIQLNLSANLRSQAMRDPKLRALVMRALDRDVIAKVVTKRAQAPKPKWDVLPAALSGEPAKTKGAPHKLITIGVNSDDVLAVNAARTVADQLVQAGFDARVSTIEASALHTTALADGSVDLVVHWQNSPTSPSQYSDQFGCATAHGANAGGVAGGPGNTNENTDVSATKPTTVKDAEPTNSTDAGVSSSSSATAPKNDQSEPQGDDTEVSKAQSTVGNNISGFCSGRIDRIVERAVTNADDRLFSSQAKIDEDIAAQNAVLPLLGEQHLVATNPTLQGPSADLSDWPFSPTSGIFPSAARWTLQDGQTGQAGEASSSATGPTTTADSK